MYKKIIILGGSGSGKSTLAHKISLYTGYPLYHLDNLLLNSDWSIKEKSEWEKLSQVFLSKEIGVVDGNYSYTIPNRIKWADLIIFIDIPTRLQLYRIFRRNIRIKLGLDKRHGHPDDSREKIDLNFIFWVFNWNKNRRMKTISLLESLKDKKVIKVRNSKELDLKKLFQ